MAYTKHYARQTITSLQAVLGNWYVTVNSPETTTGIGTSTQRVSIEYPIGSVPQEFLFSGTTPLTLASGGQVLSDVLTLNTAIPAGAIFRTRTRYVNASGIIFHQMPTSSPTGYGQGTTFGPTTPDTTLTQGEPTISSYDFLLPPLALVAMTTRPSVLLIGDSRTDGEGDTMDYTFDVGELARSIGQVYGYINNGIAGDTVRAMADSYTMRGSLAAYCSGMIINAGTNDITSYGQSASSTLTALTTLLALPAFANMTQRVVTTISPRSNSSVPGNFTSTSTQSLQTNSENQVTYNEAIRAGQIVNQTGFFDIDDIMESGRNSGLWRNLNGIQITDDGAHANKIGVLWLKESGVVNPTVFLR